MSAPTIFMSYSWDDDTHKKWVADLATSLRSDGVNAVLDQWNAVPGDQLPSFMENEIRENDYVLIICTPNYRLKSDQRQGGVGYEGDIMTAEVFTSGNDRKFIPILAHGTWENSAPSWLKGKYYIDLSTAQQYKKNYLDLIDTLLGTRPVAPPLQTPSMPILEKSAQESSLHEPIRIIDIIFDEVTEPSRGDAIGSALYSIPFRLSKQPSSLWAKVFEDTWNRPPQYTSMHRPGIASIQGGNIILNGTTIEEVENVHRDTLVLCVNEANRKEAEIIEHNRREAKRRRQQSEAHQNNIENTAKNISFD